MKTAQLLTKIKEKKEFAGLSDEVVSELLKEYSKKHTLPDRKFSPKEEKVIVKEIRSNLRKVTGMFQFNRKNRKKLLEENKISELLRTHSSTRERICFYPKLKKKISSLKINSILDLGCGLNPIFLSSKKIRYLASDIRQDELELIKRYFRKKRINGKTFVCDLRRIPSNLPRADLCIIFKVLDIIDDKSHRISEKIIEKIPCDKILVSFATKKLSGKSMNDPKRIWFEKLLEKFKMNYKTFSSENEVFYLAGRNKKKSRTAGN